MMAFINMYIQILKKKRAQNFLNFQQIWMTFTPKFSVNLIELLIFKQAIKFVSFSFNFEFSAVTTEIMFSIEITDLYYWI